MSPTSHRRKVAVLISGRGSNMQALVAAASDPAYPVEIILVVSNKPNAAGLAFASEHKIATAVIDHRTFDGRQEFEAALDAELVRHKVELVCLAGFMRVLTEWFINRWTGRLINIHPALMPSFKGLHTHERALAEGVKIHGCTVHHVVPDVDAGPIIAQAAVPVLDDDTADSLGARVLEAEHQLFPMALALLVSGQTLKKPAGSHSPDQPMLIVPDGA
jgi:phosphoribosylglycinamide formyltransferase-1